MEKKQETIKLTPAELELSKFIFEEKKRVEVLRKLMKGDKYYNQLCEQGGSRAAIADALDDLVAEGILTVTWQVKENKPEGNPAPFKAVKMFHIKEEYRPIIEKLRL